jgi:hypothetical protein
LLGEYFKIRRGKKEKRKNKTEKNEQVILRKKKNYMEFVRAESSVYPYVKNDRDKRTTPELTVKLLRYTTLVICYSPLP